MDSSTQVEGNSLGLFIQCNRSEAGVLGTGAGRWPNVLVGTSFPITSIFLVK